MLSYVCYLLNCNFIVKHVFIIPFLASHIDTTGNFLQRNFTDFLRTNSGIKPFHSFSSCNLGARFLLGGRLWHPRCLHSTIVLILCIMCLFCLKKDLIVKIKGYLCKYAFIQGPFYNLIWIGRANIAFVEGLFVKFSVIT